MDNLSFPERVREESRLQALKCLAKAADYTAADFLLQEALHTKGLVVSIAAVRVELAWLNEQGLLVTQRPGGTAGFTLATLTERGLDVANGASLVPRSNS